MVKLSQKELLNEGLGSMLKTAARGVGAGIKKGAQVAGAVGSALKTASEQGLDATWTGVAKGAAEGWSKTGDFLTSKRKFLDKYLDELGLMPARGEESYRGRRKLAVVDVKQYDYDESGQKVPMQGAETETRKFKFKDNRWEQVREKQRKQHQWGVKLDPEDVAEAKSDSSHPLTGKIVKHQTSKGNIAYGTLVGVVDEYAGIHPFKGNKAPGIYGKQVDEIEESTAEEAANFYSGGTITASYSQKDLLRQLTLLFD